MKIMGCCFSCKDDDDAQGGESSERQQLLRDPVSNSTPVVRVPNRYALKKYEKCGRIHN